MEQSDQPWRFLVLRVPGSGPKALIGEPNDFATEAEALTRIASVEATHTKAHHTHLEIMRYSGNRLAALDAEGVIY